MKLLKWINTNLLFLLSLFLLAFIPLFPKLPLLDAIPGYIVKVRIEDILVVLTGLVWLREVRAKRIEWKSSYFWFVLIYALVGATSIFLGVVLLHSIPLQLLHLGKSGLHLIRYLEYFTLFFFLFSAVKTKRQVSAAIVVVVLTLLGVVGYGLGQKYLRFPVYSTMNREYSKGEKLYLQEGARPQSTFAGHYDLAAYLVIVLPLLLSLSISQLKPPSTKLKLISGIGLLSVEAAGILMLILSGSKTAIAAFGLGTAVVLLLHWLSIKSRKAQIGLAVAAVVVALVTGAIGWRVAPQSLKVKIAATMSRLQSGTKDLPSDLVGDGYEEKLVSTVQSDGTTKLTKVREKSTWSPNALKYGLSMGIRLDTLWPQALLGFVRNPLTGTGYGTLAMLDTGLFQEADSTDNNYLRVLGETGILGFITFYGMLAFILWEAISLVRRGGEQVPLLIGLCGGIVGLIITAIYLDIFAASKVAFVFWALSGLVLKAGRLQSPKEYSAEKLLKPVLAVKLKLLRVWPLLLAVLLAFFLLHQNPFMAHNPTKDISDVTLGLEEVTAASCFITNHVFSLCRSTGLVLKPHLTPYAVLLVPWLSTFKIVGTFYYLNLIILLIGLGVCYFLLRKNKAGVVLLSLVVTVSLASLLNLTSQPLDPMRFLLAAIGFPALSLGIGWFLTRVRLKRIRTGLTWAIWFLLVAVTVKAFSGDLANRFRQLAPNYASIAVQEANGVLESKPDKPAYLATVLNPYFVDQYGIGKYSVLPLSLSQPYIESMDKVWGVPSTNDLHQLYRSLLGSSSQLYVSDYGIDLNPQYRDGFNSVKQTFDLSYVHLGCDERCNLYSVGEAKPIVSTNISSPFNGRVLRAQDFPSAYQFAVVSNRFDSTLSDTEKWNTSSFVEELNGLGTNQRQFLIFSGDVGEKAEPVFTKIFTDGFAASTQLPILYSAGNADLIPSKDIDGGYQEFFTNREYFILMNVGKDSQLTSWQQLKLYNSLLKLEKLPRIKTLFIVSHDLNWQDESLPTDATAILERKLKAFPYLKTFVFTANHSQTLKTNSNWFETKKVSDTLTYISDLTAGNAHDAYSQVSVSEDGTTTIQGINLRR